MFKVIKLVLICMLFSQSTIVVGQDIPDGFTFEGSTFRWVPDPERKGTATYSITEVDGKVTELLLTMPYPILVPPVPPVEVPPVQDPPAEVPPVQDPDLVAHWTFDIGSFDDSGNGNDGIISSTDSLIKIVDGVRDGAIELNGVDSFVDVGTVPFPADNTGITIATWVNVTSFNVPDARVISKASSTASADHSWMISTVFDNGKFVYRARINTASGVSTVYSSAEIPVNEWVHFAVTYDGVAIKIFQNGVLTSNYPKTGELAFDEATQANIGRNPDGYGPFHGLMDDTRIYSRALTIDEVNELIK